MTDLDPKFTFDSFVVGPANRLASAAARRAADSPGTSYNPLFIYAASGLGKSHILTAIAHHTRKAHPKWGLKYQALEGYLGELAEAIQEGNRDQLKEQYADLQLLLLDDVQFLTGQPEAQEMLLRTLDQLSAAGSQIVLASDRPPAEINGLDARLLSRFSGGLIVDIGPPEFETRVAITRKKAAERAQQLLPGVAEALARYPFKNVRELGGALNKIFATQDLEERQVSPGEVASMVGAGPGGGDGAADEFGSFLSDLSETVAATVEAHEEPWRKTFREAAEAAEREGFVAARLHRLLAGGEPPSWEQTVERFRAELARLREIDAELDRLDNPWPDAARGVLKDPDRLEEAEALLASVRERQRPFPRLGPGPSLRDLGDHSKMAVKAAQQLVSSEKPEYNPLYLWSPFPGGAMEVLGAAGRAFQEELPDARMAVTSVSEFAEDFIRALGEGVAGAWRERWWTVDLLLVHGVEALSDTERAQDEFFHLFEALKRRGSRVLLVADRPPGKIGNIDERLRSRFEGGLVLEVDTTQGAGSPAIELVEAGGAAGGGEATWIEAEAEEGTVIPPLEELKVGDRGGLFIEGTAAQGGASPSSPPAATRAPREPRAVEPPTAPSGGEWFPSRENVVLHWPRIEDLLLEDLD